MLVLLCFIIYLPSSLMIILTVPLTTRGLDFFYEIEYIITLGGSGRSAAW